FSFLAEDGIRDFHVTGVQTCALPISACVYCERERLHVYVIEVADGDLRYVALTYQDYRAVVDDPAMIDHVAPLACYVETSSASEPGERIGDWGPLARGEDTPEGREAIRAYRERH